VRLCSVTGGLEPVTGDYQFSRSPGCALSALRLGKVEIDYGIMENISVVLNIHYDAMEKLQFKNFEQLLYRLLLC
jgi:hypothetical protein